MRTPVYIVYLQYGDKHQREGVERLRSLAHRFFPAREIELLVVDNALTGGFEHSLGPNLTLISGENSSREFSGYDRGVEWLERAGKTDPNASYLLANDTYLSSYGSDYIDLFSAENVSEAESMGGILGYTDGYPKPITLYGYPLKSWVRTSLMFLPGRVLSRLRPFALPAPRSEVLSGHLSFFVEPSPLSENYREYLKTWLFDSPVEGSEFREAWHSKKPLDERTLAAHTHKAWAILCEHFLSARAIQAGIPLISVNGHGVIRDASESPARCRGSVASSGPATPESAKSRATSESSGLVLAP